MNPNSYYYNAQKQNYMAPLKDNQELLMQRNLYYDNKGQPSHASYNMMPNSNLLNSQVYQQQQPSLNASQIQNMNLANQQLPIPQDINSNSKLKYVDSLQRMPNESVPYQNMNGNPPNQPMSQEWLKMNQNINSSMGLNRMQGSQPSNKNIPYGNGIDNRMLKIQQQNQALSQGQSLVEQAQQGFPQKNMSARNNENVRTPNFQNVNLQIPQQQSQQSGQEYIANQNPKMSITIDKRNMYMDKSNSEKLTPTQQNLANSIIQYRKKVMEGTAQPDPSFENYIKQCYGLLSNQEQIEINNYIQNAFVNSNIVNSNNSNDIPKLHKSLNNNINTNNNSSDNNNNNNNNRNMGVDMDINKKKKKSQIQPPIIKNEPVKQYNNQDSINSNKSRSNSNSGRQITKHDLNSLKYMIDSREKFDELFYRRFLPEKYKYFTPLQIMGKNIDYYDIYSLLSFVGFEKLDVSYLFHYLY